MPLDVPWPFPELKSAAAVKWWHFKSSFTLGCVGLGSKVMAEWLNTLKVENREALMNAVDNRPSSVPLITVCNHHSCLDDPTLWGILDARQLCSSRIMRWTAAAHDICFTRQYHATFFKYGKTVPVVRGEGVFQKGMDFCLEKLNSGDWVHFFPEGKVNMTTKGLPRLKWGVGRLIAECKICPIVLPFWHVGMDKILPTREPYIPRFGKLVTVKIGNPIDFSSLRMKLNKEGKNAMEKRKAITDRIEQELLILKDETEKLHHSNMKSNNLIL